MVKKQTPFNKAIVQDWSDLEAMDNTDLMVRVLSQRQIAALVAMCEYLKWRTRYDDPPDQDTADEFSAETEFNLTNMLAICEEVAQCLIDENEALINALANAIRTNPQLIQAVAAAVTAAGSGIPGEPLTPEQAAEDFLPENVKDEFGECDYDALWGGMLYFVQSGNRVISDFFEVLEVATNTLENMEIVSRAIPAAGDYIATAAAFADQIAETLQEGYSGAYTEAYEQSLACDLFCAARTGCELTPEMIMTAINNRLTAPIDIGDFGELMAGVASGTWVGDEIADVMFLIYFGALVYGQQFLSTIGIRPMTVIVSLGADQLASDNWTVLCDCPDAYCWRYDASNGLDTFFTPTGGGGAQAVWTGSGWAYNAAVAVGRITLSATFDAPQNISSVVIGMTDPTTAGNIQQVVLFSPTFSFPVGSAPSTAVPVNVSVVDGDYSNMLFDVEGDSNQFIAPIPGEIQYIEFHGDGEWLSAGGEEC